MMHTFQVVWLIGLLVALHFVDVKGADSTQHSYQQQRVHEHKLDRQAWKKAEDALDYTDHRQKPREHQERTVPNLSTGPQLLIIVLFTIVFAVLIIFLLRALGINIFLFRKSKQEKLFSEENLGDTLTESELDRLMKEAIGRNDFRAAVRIYYLMVIKELSQRNWINWRKEKTNYDYLREMKVEEYRPAFRQATRIFETVWYGERSIDAAGFQKINPHFSNLINRIKSSR